LEKEGVFNISSQQEGKEKVLRSIALRRGQLKFRNNLLIAYDSSCAVTGTSIKDILEAAHIIPYNGRSTNHISNGLLLRSDIHALFDLRLLSINPETLRVYCSESILQEPMYKELHGAKIKMPSISNQQPGCEALQWHFERKIN
jgi:predicted restriction endonuclease